MQNDKSPGNEWLTKELYQIFWNKLKEIFIDSVSETKEKWHLKPSQRQANITLIEKKNKDKRVIQNWRPISLLNLDLKVISKALSEKLKIVLADLISSQQKTYVKDRHIGESWRLISCIIEIVWKVWRLSSYNGHWKSIWFIRSFFSNLHTRKIRLW